MAGFGLKNNKSEAMNRIRSRFFWVEFSSLDFSFGRAATLAAQAIFSGGAAALEDAKQAALRFAFNGLTNYIAHDFNSATDVFYLDLLTYQTWTESPLGNSPRVNQFLPYVGVTRRAGNSPVAIDNILQIGDKPYRYAGGNEISFRFDTCELTFEQEGGPAIHTTFFGQHIVVGDVPMKCASEIYKASMLKNHQQATTIYARVIAPQPPNFWLYGGYLAHASK